MQMVTRLPVIVLQHRSQAQHQKKAAAPLPPVRAAEAALALQASL